ncbi:ATP-binding protein [Candidatus Poriferisocius sp.]|uniref:ATP-binding protein n=1 Tax=Candidatus Poriferisocius sp. TaxID=3101276 RepID=UPI003B02CDD9
MLPSATPPGPLAPEGYLPRVADAVLGEALAAAPIVVVEGARGTGKSWTSLRQAHSEVRLDRDLAAVEAATLWPEKVLEGARPRLVDEWQLAPGLWNIARHVVDAAPGTGCFIFTGSAHPPDDSTRHSGAGRVMRVRVRPMSLAESGESTAEVSLASLLDGGDCAARAPDVTIAEVVEALCRGGWPRHLFMETSRAQALCRAYLQEVARSDIARLGRTMHHPHGILRLLASLSRNIATTAAATTLADDIAGDAVASPATVAEYLEALRRVFVVEDLPAWSVHLKSRARLRRAPKRHLVDPSLAVATLRAGPERLWRDPSYLGQAFESLVVRDLRVYAEANDAAVYHYRDSNGHELDAVVQHGDGRWLAVEIKLGSGARLEEAARSLTRACEQIDMSRSGEPAKKLVMTTEGYGYERLDGVSVLPITALGP